MIFPVNSFGPTFQFFTFSRLVGIPLSTFCFKCYTTVFLMSLKPFFKCVFYFSFFRKLSKSSLYCYSIRKCRKQWKLRVISEYCKISYSARENVSGDWRKIRYIAFLQLKIVRSRNCLAALVGDLY